MLDVFVDEVTSCEALDGNKFCSQVLMSSSSAKAFGMREIRKGLISGVFRLKSGMLLCTEVSLIDGFSAVDV